MSDGSLRHGAAGLALVLAGLGALLLGWIGLRRSDIVAEQICYAVSGGIGGTVALLLGSALVASSSSQLESRHLDQALEMTARRRAGQGGAR